MLGSVLRLISVAAAPPLAQTRPELGRPLRMPDANPPPTGFGDPISRSDTGASATGLVPCVRKQLAWLGSL